MTLADIGYILFDCDGVLVDSEILATRVFLRIAGPYGYQADEKTHSQRFSGMMETQILEIIATEGCFTWPDSFYPNLKAAFKHAFKEELQAIHGMPDLLQRLNLPRAVVSNSNLHHVVTSLTKTGMRDFFGENTFSAQQVERPKPAPDLYLYALKQLGLTPQQGLVVEDSVFGVTAATQAGLRVIGFLGGGHSFPGHEQNLRDAGAGWIARNASELESLAPFAFAPRRHSSAA